MPSTTEASGLLIIGYGNVLRGDDAVGPLAARELQRRGFRAIEAHQLTPELAEQLSQVERATFIDADVQVGPGEVRVTPISLDGCTLDHYATPATLLGLTKDVYGRAPEAVLVSIGAESFDFGRQLSSAASAAILKLADDFSQQPGNLMCAMPQELRDTTQYHATCRSL